MMTDANMDMEDELDLSLPDPKIWLYPFLADLGVTQIEASMSGSGDSGDLDDVSWYRGDTLIPNEEVEGVLTGLTVDDGSTRHHNFLDVARDMFTSDGSKAGNWYDGEGGSALCRYELDPEAGVINLLETEYAPGEEYDNDEDDDWEPEFGETDEEELEDDDVEP
jgi:hypothetical protein